MTADQTCMDLREPKRLVFPYVRMTLAGLLVEPEPERILMLGLGGGSIPMTLAELYPEAKIDTVEIDEAVYRVARGLLPLRENRQHDGHDCGRSCVRQTRNPEQRSLTTTSFWTRSPATIFRNTS
ncbi:MAG: hypothetical protein U5O39_12160 [Gammaproteobacteria bacterium]|nr:hypothetical protein [Gammaproteobacteria bacterium]